MTAPTAEEIRAAEDELRAHWPTWERPDWCPTCDRPWSCEPYWAARKVFSRAGLQPPDLSSVYPRG